MARMRRALLLVALVLGAELARTAEAVRTRETPMDQQVLQAPNHFKSSGLSGDKSLRGPTPASADDLGKHGSAVQKPDVQSGGAEHDVASSTDVTEAVSGPAAAADSEAAIQFERFVTGATELIEYAQARVPTSETAAESVASVVTAERDIPEALKAALNRDGLGGADLDAKERQKLLGLVSRCRRGRRAEHLLS